MKKLIQIILVSTTLASYGQQALDFLENAKKLAADEQYDSALMVIKVGLRNNPADYDLRFFEVNLHLWKKEFAVAEVFNEDLLSDYPYDYDAYTLLIKCNWWAKEWNELLEATNRALDVFPNDTYFMEKHLLALVELENYREASDYYQSIDKKSAEIEQLGKQTKLKNHQQIGASFAYSSFNKGFFPWSLGTIQYQRIARSGWNVSTTYGEMFDQTGASFNADFYPRISERLRGFLEAGYSNSEIFPRYRVGAELIAAVNAVELSVGAKTLNFEAQPGNAYIYTVGVGSYFDNYYARYKSFLLADQMGEHSLTHNLVVRRFFRNRFHFVELNVTRGATPLQINSFREVSRINANAIMLTYSHLIANKFILNGSMGAQEEVYPEGNNRKRMSASVGVSRIF